MSKLQKPKPTTFGYVKFHLVDDSYELYLRKSVDEYIEQLEAENAKLKVSDSTGLKAFAEEVAYGEGTINPQCCNCRKEAAKALEGTSLALEKLSDEELQAFDDQTARWESQLDQMRAGFEDMKRKYAILEHNNAALKSMLLRTPDVRKLVKPLAWELCPSIVGNAWSTPALVGDIYFEVHNILNTSRVGLFLSDREDSLCICYKDSEDDAKQAAQECAVNIVAAACGQEVRNG